MMCSGKRCVEGKGVIGSLLASSVVSPIVDRGSEAQKYCSLLI